MGRAILKAIREKEIIKEMIYLDKVDKDDAANLRERYQNLKPLEETPKRETESTPRLLLLFNPLKYKRNYKF